MKLLDYKCEKTSTLLYIRNTILIVFCFSMLALIVNFFFNYLISTFYPQINMFNTEVQHFYGAERFWIPVVVAPLLETFIFQYALLEFFLYLFGKLKYTHLISVVLSGILFGLIHSFNTFYVFATFIAGIIFAYEYIYFYKKSRTLAFWAVFFTHFINNLTAYLLE